MSELRGHILIVGFGAHTIGMAMALGGLGLWAVLFLLEEADNRINRDINKASKRY